jgi:hypothetical protein
VSVDDLHALLAEGSEVSFKVVKTLADGRRGSIKVKRGLGIGGRRGFRNRLGVGSGLRVRSGRVRIRVGLPVWMSGGIFDTAVGSCFGVDTGVRIWSNTAVGSSFG